MIQSGLCSSSLFTFRFVSKQTIDWEKEKAEKLGLQHQLRAMTEKAAKLDAQIERASNQISLLTEDLVQSKLKVERENSKLRMDLAVHTEDIDAALSEAAKMLEAVSKMEQELDTQIEDGQREKLRLERERDDARKELVESTERAAALDAQVQKLDTCSKLNAEHIVVRIPAE
jgi:chromosome segregation ATPase